LDRTAASCFGLFALGSSLNFLALNGADNGLHLALGAALTAAGLLLDRRA
jgi:hypothetical protein